MADRQTRVLGGNGSSVQAFTLDPGLLQYVQSVFVQVDNSGGGDIQPTLTVQTNNGVAFAKKQQGRSIPAGGSGSATWALRLDDERPNGVPAGVAIVRRFPFAFNSPGISTAGAAGFPVYTPTIGDIWLDSWVQITTAWDIPLATAALGDFAQKIPADPFGLLADQLGPADMQLRDIPERDNSPLNNISTYTDVIMTATAVTGFLAGKVRLLPGLFVTADPIQIWVTDNGLTIGGDPESTQGAGFLYVITATPV